MKKSKLITMAISLLAAICLWIYVVTVVNPEGTTTISNIPVTFSGAEVLREDQGLVLSGDYQDMVTVSFTGKNSDMKKLEQNKDEISAVVDVSKIRSTRDYTLSYDLLLPDAVPDSAVTITDRTPGNITVHVEKLVKKPVPVKGDFSQVEVADGYMLDSTTFDYDTVTVEGAESVVNQIEYALISMNRTNVDKTISEQLDYTLVDANGEVLEFNVFTATLGYSRRHVFIPTPGRTTDDLLACLLQTFRVLGGVPEELVTDNMSALVSLSGGRRRRVERAWRFADEAGFRLVPCAPRSPETKGKDESANRFLSRLAAYEGEFAGWEGLRGCVARIEARSNEEPNATTGLPPAALFMREKESLRPVGNMALLESMVGDVSAWVVPPTMLVRAAGRQWSVPRRCIGRRVSVVAMPGGQVRVRMAGEEVAVHDPGAAAGPIVYEEAHYLEALEGKRWADGDIREAARANLELLDALGAGDAE